jgi:hypothetical protein
LTKKLKKSKTPGRLYFACRNTASDVFDYAAYLLFQGLTNATYIQPNTTDKRIGGPLVGMIQSGHIDTMSINQLVA